MLEPLERRALLSGLPLDSAITSALEQGNSVVKSAVDTLDTNLFDILGNSLPLVGSALGTFGQKAQDFFDPIGTAIAKQFSGLGQTVFDTNVESAISAALASLNPAPNLKSISDTTTPNQDNTAIDNVEFNLDIAGDLIDSSAGVGFSTGLKPLNLQLSGNLVFSLGYELQVGLGIDDNGFYIDGTATNFALTLKAGLPGLQLSGNLFFLVVTATDGTSKGNTGFDASLNVSLADKNNNHINLGQQPLLDLSASFAANATAQVHLQIQTGFGNSAEFPSLDADFDMTWVIAQSTPLDGSSNSNTATFGSDPDVELNNVRLDVGSFFNQFVSPIVNDVKNVLAPIQPVLDVLNKPIPVLSDIGPLKQALNVAPNAPVTLLDVIAAQDQGADTKFLKAVVALDQLATSVPSVNGNVTIPLGGFTFQENGLDARVSDLQNTPLTKVDADATTILNALKQIPGVGGFVSQILDTSQFGGDGAADDGGGVQFPLIQNPQLAFGLLLGQNVPLFTFDMPTFRAVASFDKFFPLLGPLGVEFKGTLPNPKDPTNSTALEALLHFSFGYDTAGIAKFASDGFKSQDIGDLLNGFYVSTTDQPDGSGNNFVPQVQLLLGFGAFASLKFPAFDAGVGGGINGNVTFTLNDADKDGKLRFDEIRALLQSGGPLSLFDVSGELTAELEAFVQIGFQSPFGFVGYQNNFDIAKVTLLNFNFQANGDPIPTLATPEPNGVLLLDVGQFAFLRKVGDLSSHDETFTVDDKGPSPDGNGERVLVTAYGYETTYDDVKTIQAFCGPGDSVTIDPGVTAAASLFGGVGKNHLVYDGSGDATLQAFGSDNVLSGGSASNVLDASQATGNDTLIGGSGTNEFHAAMNVPVGGTGDTMIAGPHNDVMFGGDAVDIFGAGAGDDVMNGGSLGGVFNWQEGDGALTIIGGPGPAANYHLQATATTPGAAFIVRAGASLPLEVDVALPGGQGTRQILAKNVGVVSVDDQGDGAKYTINDLSGTGVHYVQANEHEGSHAAGAPDAIIVNGSATLENDVDISADPIVNTANIQNPQGQIVQPVIGPVTNVNMTIKQGSGAFGGGTVRYQIGLAIPKTSDSLTVNTGAANDTVSVESTQSALDGTSRGGDVNVNTIGGNDIINVGATASTVAQGIGTLDRVQGNLFIDAGSGTQNQLNIDESGGLNGDTLALTADHTFRQNASVVRYQLLRYTGEDLAIPEGGGPPGSGTPPETHRFPLLIQYTTLAQGAYGAGINLYLTRAPDRLYVTDTMQGAPTTIYADGNQLNTNPNDQIVVGYNPLDTYGDAKTTAQSFLDSILGPLDVEGTSWSHNGIGDTDLRVFDEAGPAAAQYTVTANQVDRAGLLPVTYHLLGEIGFTGNLSLDVTQTTSNILVQGTATDTTTGVNTGAGSGTILVGQPVSLSPPRYSLDSIQGQLDINGGSGTDALSINDTSNLPYTYSLSATNLLRMGAVSIAPINFKRMATVDVFEPSFSNTTTIVQGTPKGTPVMVQTGDGNDGITVMALNKIKGPLDFAWNSGIKSLVFNDVSAGANTYTLKPGELDRTGAAQIQFDNPSFVELFVGSSAKEAVNVPATAAGTAVSIVAGSGPDSIVAASGGSDLTSLAGPLNVEGGGATTLSLEDQNASAGRPYSLYSDQFLVAGQQPVNFTDLAALVLDSGTLGNLTHIYGTAASTATTVNAGPNDQITVADANQTIQGILGPLSVSGTGVGDSLTVDDINGTPMSSYVLTANTLTKAPSAPIVYKGLASLEIDGSNGGDVYHVKGTAAATQYQLSAQGPSNLLWGPTAPSVWTITGPNAGKIGANVKFMSIQNLKGDAASDTFAVQSGGSLGGSIAGGGGANTLDYSGDSGDMVVNLRLGTATDIAGGIGGIQNVIGSQGNDLIVGNALSNVLQGGTGRNIIIGGAGADTITGGGGENILIGGTTAWDANAAALSAIMNEWEDPNLTFSQRVTALRAGIVVNNQTYALNSSTVMSDASPDNVVGGGGPNWFWVDADDTINNGAGPKQNDQVN
jgi:hypothetical protein